MGTQNNISQLKNKIILLPNADPGWDWVFSLPIKGLITKYGGPNSHMAIRAAEKNIVSVFGVGEDLFKQIQKSKIVEIDPKNKNYTLIHETYFITSNSINKNDELFNSVDSNWYHFLIKT